MDTKIDLKIVECGNMAENQPDKLVVGAKQIRKALKKGDISSVFLAQNADPAITEPLEVLCREHKIPVTWVRSMKELGSACGIEVGAAAAAICQ
jgi:large subunit ribosomal protein L7A